MFTCNSRTVPGFGSWFLSFTLLASALQAGGIGSITTGAPGASGTVDITVTLPDGRKAPDGTNKIKVSVPINKNAVLPGLTPAAVKASAIRRALGNPVYPGTNIPVIPNLGQQQGSSTVTAADSKFEITGDTTNEVMTVADLGLSLPGSPAFATLGFSGALTQTGTDGSVSIFTASFGVDNSIFASASLTYNQLGSATADALVSGLYNQLLADLSPGLRPSLFLNLPTDTITFDFAPGSGNYWVETSNTSPGTSQFMNIGGVTPTPEPVTFFSIGTGLFLIGAFRRTRGKTAMRDGIR